MIPSSLILAYSELIPAVFSLFGARGSPYSALKLLFRPEYAEKGLIQTYD